MLYQPIESHGFVPSSQVRPANVGGIGQDAGRAMQSQAIVGGHHRVVHPDSMSPERRNSMSVDSTITEEQRVAGIEKCSSKGGNSGKKSGFQFQRPSSRTGTRCFLKLHEPDVVCYDPLICPCCFNHCFPVSVSFRIATVYMDRDANADNLANSPGSRATSVKAEPGSALESNASASVRDKITSPGFMGGGLSQTGYRPGFHETLNPESTDSSMCSLLKSSDEFTPTTGESNNGSDEDCGKV